MSNILDIQIFSRTLKCMSLCIIMLMATMCTSLAGNLSPGLQQAFDWQDTWGAINFGGGSDAKIPSSQLQAKADIKRVVSSCGTQDTNLSSLRTYQIDVNGDGKQDFVIDGNGYFPQYFNTAAYNNYTCSINVCTADEGCFISIYVSGQDTNLITANNNNSVCPATPELNTSCLTNCASTADNCPENFKYNMRTVFNQRVLQWNFISADSFVRWAAGYSYQVRNTKPVLVAHLNSSQCYLDELSANNNQCIKYYQYDDTVSGGTFVDLYAYQNYTGGEYDTRFTTRPFDRSVSHLARGMVMGAGFAHRLASGGTIDTQFSHFTRTNRDGSTTQPGYVAVHISNSSNKDYFVPANTDIEFSSFLNYPPHGVEITPATLKFTDWVGDIQCPKDIVAGKTVTIAAQRFCQSSTSAYLSCQECIDAKIPGWEQGCSVTQVCQGTECMFDVSPMVPLWSAATIAALQPYDGTYTNLAQCNAQKGVWANLVKDIAPDGNDMITEYGGCDGAFAHVCAQGNFCFAGNTLISLPKGKSKRIDQIKAGDVVLGFKGTKDSLKPYKVKTVAVTPKQALVSINGTLQLTGNHDVVTSAGVKKRASSLVIGDVLLRGDGKKLVVKTINKLPEVHTVYNLQLEDAGAGFVADNVRVVGYQ
jgi:hypothetical protein